MHYAIYVKRHYDHIDIGIVMIRIEPYEHHMEKHSKIKGKLTKGEGEILFLGLLVDNLSMKISKCASTSCRCTWEILPTKNMTG